MLAEPVNPGAAVSGSRTAPSMGSATVPFMPGKPVSAAADDGVGLLPTTDGERSHRYVRRVRA
jgi:hypothetical protein